MQDAGIGDQRIKAAEDRNRGIDRGAHRLAITHVGLDEVRAGPCGDLAPARLVAAGADDRGSLRAEPLDDRRSDSRGPTRDQCAYPSKPSH